jgi:hypothetical protein
MSPRAAFNADSVAIVDGIRQVFDTFDPPLTVRQVFYQLAAKSGLVPLSQNGYRQAQRLLLRLRELGELPWSWFADRSRRRIKPSAWADLDDFGDTVRGAYRKDLWQAQPEHVEVWLEKEALAGFFEQVLGKFGVALYPVHGFSSVTFLYEAALALREIEKPKFLYYFGDHDPSGKDIERALFERLRQFGVDGEDVHFERVAIKLEDIEEYNLRPLAAKPSDSRTRAYRQVHGDRTIELDALPPDELRLRISNCVSQHIDFTEWVRLERVEATERETVKKLFARMGNTAGRKR